MFHFAFPASEEADRKKRAVAAVAKLYGYDGEALSPSRFDRSSHGLRSLWEMLELDASAFYHATTALESMRGFIAATSNEKELAIPTEVIPDLCSNVNSLIDHLETMNAKVSGMAAVDLKYLLENDTATWSQFADGVKDVYGTMKRELTLTRLFVLEPERQRYFYAQTPLFGTDFQAKFVSAAFDLDEAAKCFALSRPTACVFHLMRVMEIGIKSVARCLQIPDPIKPADRNWGNILQKIRDGITVKWPTGATRSTGAGAFFEALYASLDAVRNPWRNATMHVENKYTDDEAEHILVAVKGFMMKLASRCDENGDPKA